MMKANRLPCLLIFTFIITGVPSFGMVFSDMISVEPGVLPGNSFAAGQSVSEFQIGKWEVTWGKWKEVRDWSAGQGYDISAVGLGSGDEHPVHTINWYDALKWLNAASEMDGLAPVYRIGGQVYKTGEAVPKVDTSADGYRLPTEAEWEWAARGGLKSKGYTYCGSNNLAEVGCYADNSSGAEVDISDGNLRGTWPTGSKKGNELEIFDMSGNVSEWCWDANVDSRRLRGGNWWASAGDCSVTVRLFSDPTIRHRSTGFRPARNRLLSLEEIQYPVTRDWLEIKVPEVLATPDPEAQKIINVVVVNYLSSADGVYVKQGKHYAVSDWDGSPALENVKIHEMNKFMNIMNIKGKYSIEEGFRFRNFGVNKSKPYMGIKVLKVFNIYKEYPDANNFDSNLPPDDDGHPQWHPDPFKVFDIIGLKDLVEESNVKEVWFNTKLGIPESMMSTPFDGYRSDNGWWIDLPIYNKTYIVYSGWVHRSPGEFIHCRGHQYEAQLQAIDADFFWRDFVGAKVSFHPYWPGHPWYTDSTPSEQFPLGKCGSCHFAPNSRWHYDYDNSDYVDSTIFNWSPDTNIKVPVNNELWNFTIDIPSDVLPKITQVQHWISDSGNTIDDPQSRWLITWFQTIPSNKPIIFNKNGATASQVENWWDIIYEWDETIKSGKKLYKNGLFQSIAPFSSIPSKAHNAAPFIVNSPLATSGLPVTISIASGPATISADNTVTLTGSGTVVLAANQPGDTSYLSAESVTTSFTVSPPPTPTPVVAPPSAPSGGGAPAQVQKPKKGGNSPSAKKSSGGSTKSSAKKSGGGASKKPAGKTFSSGKKSAGKKAKKK